MATKRLLRRVVARPEDEARARGTAVTKAIRREIRGGLAPEQLSRETVEASDGIRACCLQSSFTSGY